MTRRITLAILMVVWLALLGAGLTTYFITRSLLIADLDDTIKNRVANFPEVEPASAPVRAVIKDVNGGRNIPIPDGIHGDVGLPQVLSAVFTPPTADNPARLRTLTLQAYKRRLSITEELSPLIIVSSLPAEHIDTLLRNLTYSLAAFGLAAAAASMLVARAAARVALRPMFDAAKVIGEINERSLDRRISTHHLPSELVPVARKLNDMLARLETAFAQRKQFLADASHELRTPVAALVVTLEVALRRQRDIGDYVRALDTCLTDARQLHHLVVALVNQARAERFAGDPDIGPVSISNLLRQCAHMVAPLADTKGLALVRDIPDNLMVLSDEQLLRSMVSNLLSNAVEYTPGSAPADGRSGALARSIRGQITLSAHWRLSEKIPALPKFIAPAKPDDIKARAGILRIQVKDNGPGISPEHRKSIFEPFFRADAARSNPEHHLGLGLAQVQTHARALGGICTVESPPPDENTGALFTLELPTVEIRSENTATKIDKNRVIMGKTA